MKRSFCTGMGGGGMLKAGVQAVKAGIGSAQHSISTATGADLSHILSLSSVLTSVSSSRTLPAATPETAVNGFSSSSSRFIDEEDDDWERIDGSDEGFRHRVVFGPVPSREEAEDTVSALRQVIIPSACSETDGDRYASVMEKETLMDSTKIACHSSSSESESDWIEPVLQFSSSKALDFHGHNHVLDAFWLLNNNPSVQRMVISLSSDEDVWDAVMNNEVVKELRDSFYADHPGENDQKTISKETDPEVSMKFLRWLFYNTKAKITEIISKILKLTNDLFRLPVNGKPMDGFETTLKSSLMLSIVVLLIIMMNRIKGY